MNPQQEIELEVSARIGSSVKERVQKLMAQANIGSRRACEALIRAGRVQVNGQVITLGAKADPEADRITVDGAPLTFESQRKVYLAFHKPRNVLSTAVGHRKDERRTFREFIPYEGHLFTIGRLDADSEGLMVLTNDGDLTNKLAHPRYQHTKTYKAEVYGLPTAEVLSQWESGVELEEGRTAPCSVHITHGDHKVTTLRIVMTEGRKRQIRRVAAKLGHPVRRLIRTHIGKFALGTLRPGEWREMNADEVKALSQRADEILEIRKTPKVQRRRQSAAPRPKIPLRNRKKGR